MTERGVVVATMRGRKECLCGRPVLAGQSIVKRWGGWMHLDCYRELRTVKRSIAEAGL